MFSVRMFFQKDKSKERIGHILFSKEILPLFHETPPITNKILHVVTKNIDDKTVVAYEVGSFSQKEEVLYLPNRVLTQDGVPIKSRDAQLKSVELDNDFTKEGYQRGQVYLFRHLGYLNNLDSDKIVEAVTDQLVIFREIGSKNLYFYTYKELKDLESCSKLQIVSS
mgnify:CR=1 FL=1|jgi:hypothetical protein